MSNAWVAVKVPVTAKPAVKVIKGKRRARAEAFAWGSKADKCRLIRRLPKRGFNNAAFHKRYAIVNLDDLNAFKAGTAVERTTACASRSSYAVDFVGIKILGDGELKHGLKVEADKISAAAREKIEKAGGTITLREKEVPPCSGW